MAVSEKQKESIRKWDREHMQTISCRLRKEEAQSFKEYCSSIGSNPAAEVKKYVRACLDGYNDRD